LRCSGVAPATLLHQASGWRAVCLDVAIGDRFKKPPLSFSGGSLMRVSLLGVVAGGRRRNAPYGSQSGFCDGGVDRRKKTRVNR
jgi:hypothetical protein